MALGDPPSLRPAPAATQLRGLLTVQLANWRWSWRAMVVLGIAAPLISLALLSRVVGNRSDAFLSALLVGNVLLALMFENQNKMASHFAFMRTTGALTFFAALPIRQSLLVAATALAFFLLSIPAFVITAGVGATLLGVHLDPSAALLIVAPVVALSLSGMGAVIGTLARSFEEAGSVTLLLNLVLLAAGPVIVPESRVPDFFVSIGYLNPAVYAASALRQSFVGPVTIRLVLDLGVLTLFGVALMVLASRMLIRRTV